MKFVFKTFIDSKLVCRDLLLWYLAILQLQIEHNVKEVVFFGQNISTEFKWDKAYDEWEDDI